jgi:hypothetical protein
VKPAQLIPALLAAALLVGCGHKHEEGDGHDHGKDDGHSHGDDAESFSGATHKEGTGITLLDETRILLDIQTVEVQEQTLPRKLGFTARVFNTGEAGGNSPMVDQQALGTISTNEIVLLRPGLPAQLQTASGVTVTGVIQQVSQPVANAEAEVIAAFPSAITKLRQGDFVEVSVSVPDERSVIVVPREAVIKSATGNLVYAVNGDAYILTWVELGAEANGLVEVSDGLLPGDSVVTHGAMDLWLVELRAVKGGQGCCPAPPKKGKG